VVRRPAEVAATRELADDLGVKRASNEQVVATLSGGNQQKVLFGRWLMERPRVLIADEPTSGVDVSAKRAIYDLLARLADDGVGVLLISSESEEILGLADRALVMHNGQIVAELSADEATEHGLIEAAFGTFDRERRAA
jgi:ABC-type sugar transport system ATPase subunit